MTGRSSCHALKYTKMKAQVRMGETIAVLVIFFFLVMIGFSFYASFQQRQIDQQLREMRQLEAIQVAQKVYYLPELQCSSGYQLTRESCWDTLKMQKFQFMVKNDPVARQYYFDILQYSKITVTQIYPTPSTTYIPDE